MNLVIRDQKNMKIRDQNDPWFFLKSLHLPKLSLLNRAASDSFFIRFVSNFILDLLKVQKKHSSLTVAFNVYCSVYTGAIEYSVEVSERIVTQMLPSHMKGLNLDILDFSTVSYVIIARLLSKCTLSSIILDKFMQKISKHKIESLKEEAILVYLVLYQSQVAYKNIPKDALAEIIVQEWCPSILQELNTVGYLIYPFLEVLIKCLFENGIKEDGIQYRTFLLNSMNQLNIDEEFQPACINVMIDSVPLKLKKLSDEVHAWITEVIEITEKQYPTQFDKQVYQILVAVKDNERKRKLQQVFKAALTLKRKFDIFEKLYYPNALIRTEAMKFISSNFEILRGMERDMLIISLEDRLKDEDVEVVKALSLVKNSRAIKNDNLQRILIGKDLNLQDITKFLILVLKNDNECLYLNDAINSPSLMLLDKLYFPFISSLSEELQFTVLDIVIEISTFSENPNILLASNKLFKYIELDAKQILPYLIKMKDVQSQRLGDLKKRRRVATIPNVDILDTIECKKGIKVLEFIRNKKKIFNISSLIPIFFDVLKHCLDFDEQAAVEYPKQLISSLILHSCKTLKDEKILDHFFNMELIVQCIRASSNPQTHHHALLVLSYCASLIPTQVLRHIIAFFTSMGSSVLRHDDAYSFQLISNIIDSVIPILVSDGNKEKIISVLRVFVDVFLDVPEHRRIVLYTQLLERVNPVKHFYLFLLLVFVSHVLHSNRDKIKDPKHRFEDSSMMKRIDIAVSLANQFSTDVVFVTCANLIKYLKELPIGHENLDEVVLQIDLPNFTPKQFRHLKYTVLIFMNTLISSKEFVSKVALLEDETLENLEYLYKDLIINIIFFIQKINPVVDEYINTNQAQYWKAIQHQNLEILDGINALLATDMFLLVIKGLMTHNLSNIQNLALDWLNSKLQGSSSFNEECKTEQLHALINPLLAIIDKINTEENEAEHVIIQTALLSLKLIIKRTGSEDPDKYVTVLEFITNLITSGKSQGNVLASVILCLAELCVTLRSEALQNFPVFMPALLKIMKQQKYQDCPTLLCLSLLAVMIKIFECFSLFIGPYLKKLLSEICQFTSKWENLADDQKLSPFIQKLKNMKQKLGEVLDPRVLIPAIKHCYIDLIKKNKFTAIGPLMGIFSQKLTYMSGCEVESHLPKLTKFFISALEFRNIGKCDIEQTNIVEKQIIDALSSLVLKLDGRSFSLLCPKIYDWAVTSEIKNDKIITFYNVYCSLVKHLKTFFVMFAVEFFHNAAQILDNCNNVKTDSLYFEDKDKSALLLDKVIETLSYVFKYTVINFDKGHFEILMQPLIDQLENDFNGITNLVARNDELLTPCIVNLAIVTANNALRKQMTYQILMKTRSSNSHIRSISLKCLTEMVKQLGEDFLPLMTETIPFLSVLLKDKDATVEKNCRKVMLEMAKVEDECEQKYMF